MQRLAATALGEIGSEKAIAPLISVLQDPDPEVQRLAAIIALGEIGVEEAIAPLTTALQDSNPEVRELATHALGAIGSEKVIAPLITALQDPSSGVRFSAVEAIRWIGPEKAIAPLIGALQDSDSVIRDEAFTLLGQVSAASIESASNELVEFLQMSEDREARGLVTSVMQRTQSPIATAALVAQIDTSTEASSNRYFAINSLTTQQHHLQNLADSQDLLKTLSEVALAEEEPNFIRYGAFLLISSVNTPEALSLLNTYQSEFLELVEANYAANLPFYLPEPINQTSSPNPLRDEGTLVASSNLFGIITPSSSIPQGASPVLQGAEPGDARQEVAARLDGKPAVCRFEWVADRWRRCQG